MSNTSLKSPRIMNLLYKQIQLPIFQNRMYESVIQAKNCPKGNIELVEDLTTGLVYNAEFRPELMNYDSSYQNEQGVSPLFLEHLKKVAEIIIKFLGRNSLVEVGCGKGLFLENLLQNGCDVTGFDPTYEGNNEKILKKYFLPGVGIEARGLILRHVLEHVQNPYDFLQLLKNANGGGGKIYIEVPCFEWICEHDTWFDIFYEHVNYFRISDFHRMFGSVEISGHLFGGQYLFIVADLSTLRKPVINQLDRVQFPKEFGKSLTEKIKFSSNKVTIWGGASKGVIFAVLCQKAGLRVEMVIDINPGKQGKYLPASGLLVQSPEVVLKNLPQGSTILVMNSNYLEEIKFMSNNLYKYIGIDNE